MNANRRSARLSGAAFSRRRSHIRFDLSGNHPDSLRAIGSPGWSSRDVSGPRGRLALFRFGGGASRIGVSAQEKGAGEPTDAQAVYKTLDPVMLAVLTEPNVNIAGLLKTASTNVNTILANSGA